ncbi:MAG: transglycosylase SLT domain-containing protein [Halanaerobiales bacterium]
MSKTLIIATIIAIIIGLSIGFYTAEAISSHINERDKAIVNLEEELSVMKKYKEEIIIMKSLIQDVNEVRDEYYYEDIDLSKDLQYHTYLTAKRHGVEYEDVLAIMYVESRFKTDAINKGNDNGTSDYGLMQINDIHLSSRDLTTEDIMCPYKNIEVGIEILANKMDRVGSGERLYLAYNMGVRGSRNVSHTRYSQEVLKVKNDLLGGN